MTTVIVLTLLITIKYVLFMGVAFFSVDAGCYKLYDPIEIAFQLPKGYKDSKKFLTEARNLSELIEELDEHTFFRVNRKYIVNVNYIKRFIPSEKSKVVVDLTIPVNDEIVVSQENSAEFKKWMNQI